MVARRPFGPPRSSSCESPTSGTFCSSAAQTLSPKPGCFRIRVQGGDREPGPNEAAGKRPDVTYLGFAVKTG
jgi:hypothetical protein